jgi:hypothetical protein
MSSLHIAITLSNIVLLLILLYYFYQTYREVKSKFALGLVIFSIVLLVNAVLQCPLFFFLFTERGYCPYSPYYAVAAGFEFIALVILLYLVRE